MSGQTGAARLDPPLSPPPSAAQIGQSPSPRPTVPGHHVRFAHGDGFLKEVRGRVDALLLADGIEPRGSRAMVLKTVVIFTWVGLSYGLLLFAPINGWIALLLSISLGLAIAGVGFSIMHDGNHGAYSNSKRLNRLVGFSLDLVGGSSYFWKYKHNVVHHTYPNLAGVDDDVEMGGLVRLVPDQTHRWFHRFQHLYMWPLYGLISFKWHFIDDFRTLAAARIATYDVPRPKGWELFALFAFKAFFMFWSLAVPLMLHPAGTVLVFYSIVSMTLGVTLAIVFQLAHVVEEASFPHLVDGARVEHNWGAHQVETAVDFARGSRALSWYLGGLNFQIEHHLFPRICHVHYPRISKVVEATCAEHGVPYRAQATMTGAMASHYRWLRRMGRAPATVEVLSSPLSPSAVVAK